ncbi:MAG: triosephosphate isomerase [Pseudomonadota bacterium]|nr:triosephosphate isomerase [Pseudomonadota bacterium]
MSKLIVANWKMNGSVNQVKADLAAYSASQSTNQPGVVLALPQVYLPLASQLLTQLNAQFKLASQNVSQFNKCGAYTGEVSADMLKEFAVDYIIIGHSERRQIFNESGSVLLNKIEAALLCGMTPIFCIGEDKSLRDQHNYTDFLVQQLELLLQIKLPLTNLVIAYEPIWAIGTGVIPSMEQIDEIMQLIHVFAQNYLPHVKVSVLYGGSVNGKNAQDILSISTVDGVLVGGASLKVDDFSKICAY